MEKVEKKVEEAEKQESPKVPTREKLKRLKDKWEEPILKPIGRVAIWLLFSVVIALAPVFCSILIYPALKQTFNFEIFASHGELAAISIALTGEALGYLLTNRKVDATFRTIIGFGGILIFAGELILLVLISVQDLSEKVGFDPSYISQLSIKLFVSTLIVGIFCKWTEK